MKIPKYIDKALKKRIKLVIQKDEVRKAIKEV